MAKSLRSKVKRAVRAERRVRVADSDVVVKRQAATQAAMDRVLAAAAEKRAQSAATRATAMDADTKPGPSSAAAPAADDRDTADVAWSKLGVACGGVAAKRGRRAVRGRGKGRAPRRFVGEGEAKKAALHFGSANLKRKGGPKKRRVSIFNPTRQ